MNSKRNRKKEGFLQVKLSSRSALGKAWKRKWVVVQQNTSSKGKSLLLELYMEKGAYHKTVTSLLLEDVVSVRRTKSKTQEHAIEISSASKTLLSVSADSETETQDWLNMFQVNLLPPVKELPCPPGIPNDFMRLSVIPGKDSERLKLEGDYFAHISLASINLYDPSTGELALEWDLRHLKKFMLISKCHQQDEEKIVHIFPSKRSPKGEGEFIFFSAKGKQLVESIYERLSNAMTVKSRRSRSTSMLFEITPQELEQMFKEAEQPVDDKIQETEEDKESTSEKEDGVVVGDALNNGEETEKNGDAKDEAEAERVETSTDAGANPEVTKDESVEVNKDELADATDETRQEENATENLNESGQAKELDVQENGKTDPELDEATPPVKTAFQQPDNDAPDAQDAGVVHSDDKGKEEESEEIKDRDDDKSNQTNPEEMDQLTNEVSPNPELNIGDASTNPVTLDTSQESSPGVMTDDSEVHVESPETNGEMATSSSGDQNTTSVESPHHDEPTSKDDKTQEPPIQDDTAAEEPPYQDDSSKETPIEENTTSKEAVNQVKTTSLEPPKQDDMIAQEPLNQDTTSEEPVNQDTTSQEPPNQDDTIAQQLFNQEPAPQELLNQDTTSEKPLDQDTTSQEAPKLEDTACTEPSKQDDVISDEPLNQKTTSEEPPNQDITSEEPSKQHNTDSHEPPEHEDTTSPETSSAQIDTTTGCEPEQSNVHEGDKTELIDCPPVSVDQSAPEVNTGTDMEPKQEQTHPTTISEADLQPDPAMKPIDSEAATEPHKSLDSTPDGVDANASVEPAKPSESGIENLVVDDSNPNVNNSNSNGSDRQPSTALPLPNILTSRMAEALKNAHRRRLSTDKQSPTKETQTEFPSSDCQDNDQTSEIIV